ncbi:TetR/AcrR family transcriptional regulator [Cryobacterium sp. TMT1-21]|uniref:TetR/AcrR family transcriptional regulator n=1 Tax=Cryobacterium shii TaxID=1259235 RepID=A0AAQ2HFG5_9MICO|nr:MULTISPECIES: TetR/AcrR family transcriptional regulator [Cryobacterium]TFC47104.1 TetR/AcrR family transcriptional regulator [Cryobacterium shii]TFC85411.1 TetR/AcrR family transcriptional regulator [Cryobacterium sp. TmT2-59]TFD13089.1 TetR/AcrR family transcriptional regulator [Cryobacterium sp. TMT4-10]TFD13817.1 TetR/AcrR family transcriptional regulator [Cryobacterium sp. TMT1-21]TFD16970.1 TetR/AcrR family transcriptional regulator [Cryobacterium sp. TMT2-23]
MADGSPAAPSAATGQESAGRQRRAGRPHENVLSRKLITEAALTVIGVEGYGAFTMSSLARRLSVAPSALYNHVTSKQEVLRWLQDHVMTQVDVSGFTAEPWDAAVRRWAWSYRDVFAGHVPLIPIVAVLPVAGAPETLKMYEKVAVGLAAAGVPAALIVPGIVALESFIFGSALDATAPADIFDTADLSGTSPTFTAAVAAQDRDTGEPADVAFRFGLDALLAQLDSTRQKASAD